MSSTIRFPRGINRRNPTPVRVTTGLVDLLIAVQRQEVSFLPVSPQSGLGAVGFGVSGDIHQSTADAATSFTFKNGIPSRIPRDNDHLRDWYSFITQLSVLQYKPIRESPSIIDIVGISWKVDAPATRAWPYFVIPKVNRGSLTEFLLEKPIADEVRFQICVQVVEAFALLHNCGVGHGDIKPDNILIEEDHEGAICCKVADFGSCAILGQRRLPEGTSLWRAPELSQQQRDRITAKDIMCCDLYSFALLISQILIPSSDLDHVDLLLLRQSITTAKTLKDLQREGALIDKLLSVVQTSDIPSKSRAVLEMVLSEALVGDPVVRTLQWDKVLALVESKMELREEAIVPPSLPASSSDSTSSAPCSHHNFDLAGNIGEYDDFDYVVRTNTAEELEFKANASLCLGCTRQYAVQLAICYRIGFGVRRDIDVSQSWLATAGMTKIDLQSAIDRLAERYVLTGRLTHQVRDALGIGVLVSTDRIQQYRVQGRIPAAEHSISSEIRAREAELGELHFSLSKLKSDLVQIYKAQSRLREAKQLQEEIVSICANKYGERHPSVLAAQATLAAIFAEEGLLVQAEKSQRELQPLFEEVLGKEHPETVIALQGWGATLHYQARYREAADVFREVRAIRGKTLTDNHPLTIRADICLAAALHGQGLLQEADQLMSRIANSSAHSGDAVIEAHVHMSLANLYRDQNRLQEAEEAADRAIKILRRKVSQDDPIRLSAEEVLAVIYGQKRDFAKQETLLRYILQAKALLDQATPYVSTTRTFLASNLLKQGRIEESETEAQGVLNALHGSVALDAENFLECTEILATAASRKGKVTKAEKLSSDLLAACLQDFGPKDPYSLRARSFLADHYAGQGRFDKAAGLQTDNLKTLEEDGECGKFAAQAARELASSLRELSRFQEAIELCEKAILWSQKGVGDEHINTVAIYNMLAGTHFQYGNLAEADALYQSKVVPHIAGTDQEVYVLESMARLRRAQGRILESTELSQKALGLAHERLGEMHPESVKLAGNMLGSRLTQEPLSQELEQEVLSNIRIKSELLGSYHYSTIKTQSDLAYAYGEAGRTSDAEAVYNTIEAGDGQGVQLENFLRYATLLAKRADLSYRSEDYGRAQLLEEQALRLRQGLLPPKHSAVLVSMMNLAATLNVQHKYDEAEQLIRHVISLRETHLGLDAPPTLAAKNDLAAVLYYQGKLADSEALWSVVVEATRRTNLSSALLQQRVGQLYHVQNARRQQSNNLTEDNT